MTSLRSCFVSGAVLALAAAASPAQAQDSKFTASVNFGFQAGSGDISQSLQPIIYDEAAKVDVSQTYENGPLIDVGGSYMLFGKWGVGVSYNHTSGDGNATIAAQIPDPKVFDNPRAVSLCGVGPQAQRGRGARGRAVPLRGNAEDRRHGRRRPDVLLDEAGVRDRVRGHRDLASSRACTSIPPSHRRSRA